MPDGEEADEVLDSALQTTIALIPAREYEMAEPS
jgi:hypothetical protein